MHRMCYSAQLQAAYMPVPRETGAEMDMDQFVEIFGARVSDSSIRIPRAVERWFDEPKIDAERKIKSSSTNTARAEITKLEREVFAQKKRLADAERTLASKTTKAATESKRIADRQDREGADAPRSTQGDEAASGRGADLPAALRADRHQDGDKRVMRLARYHCRKPGEARLHRPQLPGLYNARRDSLGKYWKALFGASHAVMLVESFFENVDRDGKNQVLHFMPTPADTMLIACLCAEWQDPKGGPPLLSFAAITDEPPAEVAAAGHDRMIINLKPEHLDAWLSPKGRSLEELQGILSDRQAPYYEHEVMAA